METYRHIEVKPIAGAIGAEVHGVDAARPLGEPEFCGLIEPLKAGSWLSESARFCGATDSICCASSTVTGVGASAPDRITREPVTTSSSTVVSWAMAAAPTRENVAALEASSNRRRDAAPGDLACLIMESPNDHKYSSII